MTAKESSSAIWRPYQPKGEDQGLGFRRSPAPGCKPMAVIIVTQNPSVAFLQLGEGGKAQATPVP